MKILFSMFSTVLIAIVVLVIPCRGGSGSSPFVEGEKGKVVPIDKEHLIFTLDKKALAMRIVRLELAYINAQLKDPAKFVSRLSIKSPKVNAQKVLKVMKQRKKELTQQLSKYAKQQSSEQKKKGDYPTPLARPYPPPPPGNTPMGIMASDSIEDALKELRAITKDTKKSSIQCETRQGWITEAGNYGMGKMEDGCIGDSWCDGGVNYSLEDGVLPFYGEVFTSEEEIIYYAFYGQLGFKFPAPLCDSELSWQFQLSALAGLFSDADSSWVYLDCHTHELEDAYYFPTSTSIPVTLAGSVLEINDNTAYAGNVPQYFYGGMNVKAGKESALIIGLFVLIAANSGETITSGNFRVFNTFDCTSPDCYTPGVRYRLYPNEPPM